MFKRGQVYYMSFASVSDVCLYSINLKAYTVFVFYFIPGINEVKGVQVACTITLFLRCSQTFVAKFFGSYQHIPYNPSSI